MNLHEAVQRKISVILTFVPMILLALFLSNILNAKPPDGLISERLQWSQKPHAYCSSKIDMAVAPFGDLIDAKYQFECVKGDGHSSEWQSDLNYQDKGLKPETEYTYRVHVRQKGATKELTEVTESVMAKTKSNGLDSEYGHIAKIDSAFANGDIEIIPILVNGPKDNRLNFLIINRWRRGQENAYNKAELREEFIADARHVLDVFEPGHPESIEPYVQYARFFNVYAVWWADVPPYDAEDRETAIRWEEYDEIRNRIILPWHSEKTGYASAMNMFNGDGGGGGAANFRDIRSSHAMIVGNEISSFIHEFSHTAPRIPDEYCSGGIWGFGGEGTIITNEYRRDKIKWRAWIDDTTPVPTPYSSKYQGKVGLFEGGQHRLSSHYRSTARGCLMGAGTFAHSAEQLCPPCQQQSVLGFYEWVNAIDNIYPENKNLDIIKGQTRHFAIQRIKPEPDTQTTEWCLNGQIIAVNVDEIDVTFGGLEQYQLQCTISEESHFIRHDPPYTYKPKQSVEWKIRNEKQHDPVESIRINLIGRNPIFLGEGDGSIIAEISGGKPPYIYQWQDGATVKNRQQVGSGKYTLTVTDRDYRRNSTSITLVQEQKNDPSLRSIYNQNSWQVNVMGIETPADINCQWSNGKNGIEITDIADGTYRCTITHANGSSIVKDISLETISQKLSVGINEIFPSCGGENNGRVMLNVSGGRPPYNFIWSDNMMLTCPERYNMAPGKYTVDVYDQNLTLIQKSITVAAESGFEINDLVFENLNDSTIQIKNPDVNVKYLWYESDISAHIPRFPHGIYSGTFADNEGEGVSAEVFVIPNKYGLFVIDNDNKNDYGYWIHLMLYIKGINHKPETYRIPTKSEGKFPKELTAVNWIWDGDIDEWVESEEGLDGNIWAGKVADGKIALKVKGKLNGRFELVYNNYSESPEAPINTGVQYTPRHSGNYYIAAQNIKSNAISLNRFGVAIAVNDSLDYTQSIDPEDVSSANILMWLDASDLDADGETDAKLPRKAMFGWRSKEDGIGFGERNFVNYQPNTQNSMGTASWQYIWIQSLAEEVNNYQTIFMVRKEHDFSDVGAAPWRGLTKLIGIGAYGEFLMTPGVEDVIRKGTVHINGTKVDPFSTRMPKDFYLATYEFPQPVDKPLKRADGYWEGSIAECIIFDGKLSVKERRGVEEYLYRKWISAGRMDK